MTPYVVDVLAGRVEYSSRLGEYSYDPAPVTARVNAALRQLLDAPEFDNVPQVHAVREAWQLAYEQDPAAATGPPVEPGEVA